LPKKRSKTAKGKSKFFARALGRFWIKKTKFIFHFVQFYVSRYTNLAGGARLRHDITIVLTGKVRPKRKNPA
jgi:hypothetical protein